MKINELSDRELKIVRNLVITTVSDVDDIETYGAVTSGNKFVFTYYPEQVCNILAEKSNKDFGDLRENLVGDSDIDQIDMMDLYM